MASSTSDMCLYFLALFLPPLAVFLKTGCNSDFLINIGLSILGWIPGVIHAWYVSHVAFADLVHAFCELRRTDDRSRAGGSSASTRRPPRGPLELLSLENILERTNDVAEQRACSHQLKTLPFCFCVVGAREIPSYPTMYVM
jgi:uncharacterized membrane protein YqaE (UPF0057 family)